MSAKGKSSAHHQASAKKKPNKQANHQPKFEDTDEEDDIILLSDEEENDDDNEEELEEEEVENEYVVEAIKGKRWNETLQQDEYLLKWRGYSDAENTWEPASNLDCRELVKSYDEKLEAAKKANKANKANTSKAGPASSKNNQKEQTPAKTPGRRPGAHTKVTPKRANLNNSRQSTRKSPPLSQDATDIDLDNNEYKTDKDDQALASAAEEIIFVPERIIGVTEHGEDREMMFLIKWKDNNKADLISYKVARLACPQIVINFFEENIRWTKEEDNDDDMHSMYK